MKWLLLTVLVTYVLAYAEGSCADITDCDSCISKADVFNYECFWCPTDANPCHAIGSTDSQCGDDTCVSKSKVSTCSLTECAPPSPPCASNGPSCAGSTGGWNPGVCMGDYCCCGDESTPAGQLCKTEADCKATTLLPLSNATIGNSTVLEFKNGNAGRPKRKM